jgi:hypothetical protein
VGQEVGFQAVSKKSVESGLYGVDHKMRTEFKMSRTYRRTNHPWILAQADGHTWDYVYDAVTVAEGEALKRYAWQTRKVPERFVSHHHGCWVCLKGTRSKRPLQQRARRRSKNCQSAAEMQVCYKKWRQQL